MALSPDGAAVAVVSRQVGGDRIVTTRFVMHDGATLMVRVDVAAHRILTTIVAGASAFQEPEGLQPIGSSIWAPTR